MKPILQFIRATLSGGVLFLLPLLILMQVLKKAHEIFLEISRPLAESLPNLIDGYNLHNLIAIVLLVSVCFICGLAFRYKLTKKWLDSLEQNILSFIPGYTLVKSLLASVVGEEVEHGLSTVLVYNQDEEAWGIGFLVEEGSGLCTVFIPEAPRHDSGEVKIVPARNVKKINISSFKTSKSLKSFGKGAIKWLQDAEKQDGLA